MRELERVCKPRALGQALRQDAEVRRILTNLRYLLNCYLNYLEIDQTRIGRVIQTMCKSLSKIKRRIDPANLPAKTDEVTELASSALTRLRSYINYAFFATDMTEAEEQKQ